MGCSLHKRLENVYFNRSVLVYLNKSWFHGVFFSGNNTIQYNTCIITTCIVVMILCFLCHSKLASLGYHHRIMCTSRKFCQHANFQLLLSSQFLGWCLNAYSFLIHIFSPCPGRYLSSWQHRSSALDSSFPSSWNQWVQHQDLWSGCPRDLPQL